MLLIETNTAGRSSRAGSCMRQPVSGLTAAPKLSRSGPEGRTVKRGWGVAVGPAKVGDGDGLAGAFVAVTFSGVADPGVGGVSSGVRVLPAQPVVTAATSSHTSNIFFIWL